MSALARPTVLLLPGLLCDASVFEHQVRAITPHYRCLVADFSMEDSLVDMARAALAMANGPLIVVGHSMGGRVAFEMVRLAAERITRLCVMDTGIHLAKPGEAEARQVLIDLANEKGMGALAARWLPPMVHPERANDPALMGPLTRMVERATPALFQRQIKALMTRPDAATALPLVKCPMLVVVGRQDQWSPLAQHETIVARVPGAELAIVENSGHMVPVEQPEASSDVLLKWLGVVANDTLPAVPLFDRARQLRGYRLNKMAMALSRPEGRAAFRADEDAFLDAHGLDATEKAAVKAGDWREIIRLGGNVFYVLKLAAIRPAKMTEIGARQIGIDHDTFVRERLGKI
jgi:protocatechuate 4,5-dioxygenase alpha subunit